MSPKYYNKPKGSPRKDEMLGNHLVGPVKDQYKDSPSKKRMRVYMVDADEKTKQGEWVSGRNMRFEAYTKKEHIHRFSLRDEGKYWSSKFAFQKPNAITKLHWVCHI
ncbi:unnamed protein product [Lactuca virosa]|uniref:Uncharacterized protein n=1 Tax=Lactuca virosa TaxID=75947 RepID=A0AAU9MD62_9ASTR|nr:unnamed protein product [Lactuca virosa]